MGSRWTIALLSVASVAQADEGDAPPPSHFETVVHAPAVRTAEPGVEVTDEELREVPGTSGDPFRVIETLPGVNPVATGVPYYAVRGAPPAATRTYVDGIPVPALFHVAFGPSVISPDVLQNLQLHLGAAPVELGRHVGGTVLATTRPLHPRRPWVAADLRVVDASAAAELPVGAEAAVSASGRFGYPNLVLQLFAPEVDVHYGDYQLRARWSPGARDTLSALVFGSFDDAHEVPAELLGDPLTYDFHRLAVYWSRRASTVRLTTTAWGGRDASRFGDTGVSAWLAGSSIVVGLRAAPAVGLRAGLDAELRRYPPPDGPADLVIDREELDFRQVVRERGAALAGAFAEAEWQPDAATLVTLGTRTDVDAVGERTSSWADVRFAVRRAVSPNVAVRASAGTSHQPQSFVIDLPGFGSFDVDRGPQRAVQLDQGIEVALPAALTLGATAFVTRFHNLAEYADDGWPSSESELMNVDTLFPAIDGGAYGVEVLLRRSDRERVSGWVSYSMSRSERVAAGQRAPANTDRTHIVNLVAAVRLFAGLRLAGRLHARSGWPYTPQTFSYDEVFRGRRNSRRLPGFVRLDLRIDKLWRLGRARVGAYLDFVNVTAAREGIGAHYDGCYGDCPRIERTPPIVVPTLGVRADY